MDFDKYIKEDPEGVYNLHFLNKDKLTVYEIKQIFSIYGNVLGVNVTKDETGFRFIKYGSLDETIACIKGLQDSKIQLLLERSKIKDRKTNRKDFNSENLSNNGGNSTHKIFNENNGSSDILNTSQNSIYNHKFISNVTKENSSVFDEKSSLFSRQTSKENNSSVTMDYEKYYRTTKDGGFSVHFANKKGLSSEYIKDTFSSYGTVVSIYEGGGSNGLKIINYKTLDEVINCLKGLQNDSQISLLPQKDKLGSEAKATNQNSSNQWQAAKMEDISQKMFSTDEQFDSNSTHHEDNKQEKLSEYRGKPFYSSRNFDSNKFQGNNFLDTARNSGHDYKYNADEIKQKNAGFQTFDETYSFPKQNPINNEDYNQVMRKKQEDTKLYSSMKTETDSKIDKNRRFGIHDQKMPILVSDAKMKPKEFDVTSTLNKTTNSSKIVYIPMQDIIVANIHQNYGVHYILHLFEKFSPVSATVVKTISKTNIRYCHIYFKTVQDAIAVEEEFDNFDLFGKNLIVLRESRLINEAFT
ncbi:PREDICTED: uncharacterized protein LOC105151992 [Acromyrmex echinatior]|uniref:RRM domain-containing protein n=1 Tax=Acromyrmex echinatior TaxID=103372 RepID=F4X2I5_ACREC|nr:PREDICTED: uncharacterized protein LOC105151992 [Acromyrmex echinatior]XP_011064299.1 PREDICTED: uncharacterized protein LOC105151992 [Acromyrmex echinatior]EGI59310.1 hypothetical protein G5I_12515 [Acromyrmex echinatior]